MTPQLQQFIQILRDSLLPMPVSAEAAAKLAFGKTITLREDRMSPGMCKHHIIGLEFDAVLHHFTEPDTGDPHSHPWGFTTHILRGSYVEELYSLLSPLPMLRRRQKGNSHCIYQRTIHRIIVLPHGECWTLVLPEYKQGGTTYFYRYNHGWERRQWNESEWREVR